MLVLLIFIATHVRYNFKHMSRVMSSQFAKYFCDIYSEYITPCVVRTYDTDRSCLHDYTPYARGLRSGSTKLVIWWITHKRKSTNLLSYITHYTCLWCRHLVTPVICPTSIIYLDFDHASRLWSMSVPHVLPPQLWKTSHDRTRWL
jgi:hypothetical protein